MADTTKIDEAGAALAAALDCPPRSADYHHAIAAIGSLVAKLLVERPEHLRHVHQVACRKAGMTPDEADLAAVRRYIDLLRDRETYTDGVLSLLQSLQPKWFVGGYGEIAPPFPEVHDKLLAALDLGCIDIESFVAVMIGRYGPEAAEVLDDLIARLEHRRTDCSIAAGLTWAIYQIGGVSPKVLVLLKKVASLRDSCPHARPLAQQILTANGMTW